MTPFHAGILVGICIAIGVSLVVVLLIAACIQRMKSPTA